MLGAALGAIIQAVANDEEFLGETPTAMLKRLGTGFKGWTPLAEVLSQSFQSVDWEKAEDEDRMQIPLAPEDLALVQEGGTLVLLLGLGLYEGLSAMLEPGSWPDRVLQETLYYLGGQRDTLNTTAAELLEDQSMGPLGSLGPPLGTLGVLGRPFGLPLGPLRDPLGTPMGPPWAHLGVTWDPLGPFRRHLGPTLGGLWDSLGTQTEKHSKKASSAWSFWDPFFKQKRYFFHYKK